jgi:hypothetical protein
MKTRTIFLIIVCAVILVQCKSAGNNTTGTNGQTDTLPRTSSSGITYLLPSPDEILSEIISEKMQINPQLVNSRANASSYLDRKPLAMNLGVYIADFAYLNLNNNKTNALEYFNLIRDLCQKMNIYGIFNEAFFNRVQKNLMNNDSLNLIANEMYAQLTEVLSNSNRLEDYAQISTGALIESLYLSALSIPNFKNYGTVVKRLFQQKMLLENYYQYASQFRADNDVNAALSQLDSIKVVFDLAGKQPGGRTFTKDKKNHLVIKGGDEVMANELAFIRLVKGISKTRQNIVQF